MGRNKSSRRHPRFDDTDDDSLSTTSSTATSSDFTLPQDSLDDFRDESAALDGFIDALYEKRAKTREEGLKGLINALKSNVLSDFVDSKYETLLHLCIGSLKKGGGSEIALASHVIGLISVTSGAGDISQQVLSEASPHLTRAAKLGSESKARTAALEALALICFIGGSNYEATEDVMVTFWQMAKHKGNHHSDQTLGINAPSTEVKACALSAWAFLLTVIPQSRIVNSHMPQSLTTLSSLLESEDQNVRISAGEATAVLFESKNTFQSLYNRNQKEEELIEHVRGLALEAGGKGQANKKVQRSSFKEILSIVEGGIASSTSIKLKRGDVLSLDSWTHIVQYKFLTRVLSEGLQKHLQENALLHDIFGFSPLQEKKSLSTKEKRMYMSPNSVLNKVRTQNMNRRRSQAHAGQVGHYGMNEVDSD